MLPDWFSTVVMSGSLAAARIVCCVAENGRTMIDAGGRRVIAARLSYRYIQQDCGLSSSSIHRAIKEAKDKGWLSVSYAGSYSVATTYSIPVTPPAPENEAAATAKIEADAAFKIEAPRPDSASKSEAGGAFKTEAASEPDQPVSANRDSAMPEGSIGDAEATAKIEAPGAFKSGALYGGDGGGAGRVTRTSLVTGNPHHHHDGELLKKLEEYGFGDAEEFVERHHPERVYAAIDFVESLRGVKNPGAFIRRTVERPGEVPEPRPRYLMTPFGYRMPRPEEYFR